jgi:hypothetical protein
VIVALHAFTHDAQRPSAAQPSSMTLPVAQSCVAQTGWLRFDFAIDG